MKKYFWLFFLFLSACATTPKPLPEALKRNSYASGNCQALYEKALTSKSDVQLNLISSLFENACFRETIQLGSFLRQKSHDKFYDVSAEIAEVVTSEGALTEYVMESYERTYLSLLMAISYIDLHEDENAQIELRRSQQEVMAVTYNYGDDNVLRLLQAALWDRFDPRTARPYWQSLRDNSDKDLPAHRFAEARIESIDKHPTQKVFWHITGFGYFPVISGQLTLFSARSARIQPEGEFPESCSDQNSLLLSTKPWADKLANRYDTSDHPLLLTKSFARIPAGVSYGVFGVSSGIAVGVGACWLDGHAGASGQLCEVGIMTALLIFMKTADVVHTTLQPDLRHWDSLPRSFYVTTEDIIDGSLPCITEPDAQASIKIRLL